MGYGIACPGYEGDFSCYMKGKHTGNPTISYGSYEYEKCCKKDYERDGYGKCPHFKWYTEQYIVTAICKKLFPGMQVPEMEIAKNFRIRLEQNPSMFKLLEKYDYFGPILARIIENDKKLAINIYKETIIPTTKLILQGKDYEAFEIYKTMVEKLIKEKETKLRTHISIYDIAEITNKNQYDYTKPYTKKLEIKPKR